MTLGPRTVHTAHLPPDVSIAKGIDIMQAAPVRAIAIPTLSDAFRGIESLLMSGARRNAWTAVLEDRKRAKDRVETEHVLEAAATRTPQAT
ncbi:hypothetical protein GCM10010215_12200 [Streptomyces virginiae]|uniref:CBS domain-containing protein n=3 Tax=Streptomyces TaxID=1883 RepID=A0ABQ3NZF0_STRVG|nr:hypothetical protein GCM10010215_12200 [Streptomyces virginiae]GHI18142.1 hypothetical protein Scinn_76050 [Streptomyces virginiae]GLV90681.1 hypothetical protein Slala04_21350 [Streptomyces lavendulae subsp. lavendulae]